MAAPQGLLWGTKSLSRFNILHEGDEIRETAKPKNRPHTIVKYLKEKGFCVFDSHTHRERVCMCVKENERRREREREEVKDCVFWGFNLKGKRFYCREKGPWVMKETINGGSKIWWEREAERERGGTSERERERERERRKECDGHWFVDRVMDASKWDFLSSMTVFRLKNVSRLFLNDIERCCSFIFSSIRQQRKFCATLFVNLLMFYWLSKTINV